MKLRRRIQLVSLVIGGLAVLGGCNRDVRLAGKNLHEGAKVHGVTHYGVLLDEAAEPEQVAYVLFRAIRDDFHAETPEQREEALGVQFDLAALNVLADMNRSTMSRAEFIYNVVYRWTPTVSHYVDDFETDRVKAEARMVRRRPSVGQGGDVDTSRWVIRMQVEDPDGDPNARVIVLVVLAQDSGFWRVVHLGFDPLRRTQPGT